MPSLGLGDCWDTVAAREDAAKAFSIEEKNRCPNCGDKMIEQGMILHCNKCGQTQSIDEEIVSPGSAIY